jgi:hypothetical protein
LQLNNRLCGNVTRQCIWNFSRERREKSFGREEKLKNGNEVEKTLQQYERKQLL